MNDASVEASRGDTGPTHREPPTTWRGYVPHLGPGFILSASIVGSGELIATTALGARVGFTALWVIVLSCVIKVALQLQFGRHAILTGETVMESFDAMRGPRVLGVGWPIVFWLALQPLKILQVGGIVGGLALLMNMVAPGLSVASWCWALASVAAVMVALNRYAMIERVALGLLVGFTVLTLSSVAALQWTEFAITGAQVASGLRLDLPTNHAQLFLVLGAFGLTGVGGDEIMQYPYWLLEKGYAAYAGERVEGDPDWERRARGWIRVMYADALASMVAYTVVTAAFFLLGAAVLHSQGLEPQGPELISTLAKLYTDSLGPWAEWLFLLGAFVVLFSTLFSALAVWTRIFADAFSRLGFYSFRDDVARTRAIRILAFVFPTAWATVYLLYEEPVAMVMLGGVATSLLLLLVLYAAVVFRLGESTEAVKPGFTFDAALAISAVAILLTGCLSAAKAFGYI